MSLSSGGKPARVLAPARHALVEAGQIDVGAPAPLAAFAEHRAVHPLHEQRVDERVRLRVLGDRHLVDARAELREALGGRAHGARHGRLHPGRGEALGDDRHAQAVDAVARARARSRPPRTPDWRMSMPSGPAIAASMRALSRTFAVIGPAWSRLGSIGAMPV